MTVRIVTIVGARPQFIKAAVVSRAIRKHDRIEEILIHTGQHFDPNMSDVFFEELEIPRPDYNLDIHGGNHGQNTGRMLEKTESILLKEQPDLVLVYGDTDSTLAGALAATKLKIPVAHVEAGLRSFNRGMPEEINRVLTDHISTLLLTPTPQALENLRLEGISGDAVNPVGDVMYDAAIYYAQKARMPQIFDQIKLPDHSFILATIHRAENTDSPSNLSGILQGLADCGYSVILPLHPRTKSRIESQGLKIPKNIYIIDPVGYLEMVWLEKNALLIATDSGGVQKEACFHQKPCVTLRNETEWVELCEIGWNRLAGTSAACIAYSIKEMLQSWKKPQVPEFYGNGYAADKIVDLIIKKFTCAL